MAVVNAYSEKLLLPYKKTVVKMDDVIECLDKLQADTEVKRAAYVMFRNESANGTCGINENYTGIQADSGRWPAEFDKIITGVVRKKENKGIIRYFVAFENVNGNLDMLINRVAKRGLYIGGATHKIWPQQINDSTTLARAYYKEWCKGNIAAEPSDLEVANFNSMYRQATQLFL